jgi:hypothetical protein
MRVVPAFRLVRGVIPAGFLAAACVLAGVLAWVLSCVVTVPALAQAQEENKPCDLYTDATPTSHSNSIKLPSGKYNTFFAGGVIAHCRGQGNTLKSDSAEYYDEQQLLFLIGHVHYTEPRVTVDAHHGTYFVNEGRLLADTDVYAVMSSGTTMHGPHADYLRVLPGIRTRAQLTATGRPHMHLVQQDSSSSTPDTAGVDADRVFMDGDSLVYASRRVVIKRTDLTATSDSAFMNQGTGYARLILGSPTIVGHDKAHPFTLKGDLIDLFSSNHTLNRVLAMRHGDAVSKDMHLTSDTIDLRFEAKVLSRAFAWGASRARATTPERDMLADSIDVIMPQQVMHQVRSIGKAYATSIPDSTQFKSKERDWMKGDTIISYFDTTNTHPRGTSQPATQSPAPGGGVTTAHGHTGKGATDAPGGASSPPAQDSQPQVKTVVAIVKARAFYQMAPRDKTQVRPALNYVRGRIITIDLVNHQVRMVTVVDSAAGVYLEPQSDTVKKDSLRHARILSDTVPKYLRKKKGKAGAAASPDSGVTPAPGDSAAAAPPTSQPSPARPDSAHKSFSSVDASRPSPWPGNGLPGVALAAGPPWLVVPERRPWLYPPGTGGPS